MFGTLLGALMAFDTLLARRLTSEPFTTSWQVVARVAALEPSQQMYVMKKFRPSNVSANNSKSLTNFLNSIERNEGASAGIAPEKWALA